ncbi:MAG: tripartite tricarboxylate transporter substrate binding protein [Proteobacteria bacterium]|nr:tripartite tricarboxylate transporter substrate binding protein [Pseudomonadota bacterium]
MSSRSTKLGNAVRHVAAAAVIAAAVFAPFAVSAEEWPARTVTLTQTFAAGGTMDFMARSIAQAMSESFGKTFIVETKAGGSGVVGLLAVGKEPPDGYNFVISAIGPMVFRPILEKNLGFDADKDFEPVILVGATPNAVLVAPKLGVSTIADFKVWAAKNGNRVNIGMPGVGTMGQYCGALLLDKLGIEGNFINYRGATPIVQDLLGGQIELGTPAFGPSVMAARILAITSDQRLDAIPNVPTLKESGIDVTCATWNAIFAPRGTPKAIIAKFNAAIDAYLKKPETRAAFNKVGLTPWGGPPERVTAQMAEDRKTWAAIIRRIQAANAK